MDSKKFYIFLAVIFMTASGVTNHPSNHSSPTKKGGGASAIRLLSFFFIPLINLMELKTTKKLGAGIFGTAYLATLNRVPCVTKIEKYDGDLSMTSPYLRQVEFNQLASQHPDKFMSLLNHGVVETCTHQQKKPGSFMDKTILRAMKKRAQYKRCYYLSYTPILKGTLESLLPRMTFEDWLECLIQTVTSVNIMREAGFFHRDLHTNNIMYRLTKPRERKHKHDRYRWYLIDYGLVFSKRFPVNEDDAMWGLPQNGADLESIVECLEDPYDRTKQAILAYAKRQRKARSYDGLIKYLKSLGSRVRK